MAGTHRDGADRGAGRADAGGRRRAARRRDPARAPLRRPVRHRVHDRGGPALDAPGPGRQAEPAGGTADRRRHGRGRAFPLSRAEAVERVAPLLAHPPTTTSRAERLRAADRDRACRRRPGWRAGAIVTSPEAAQAAAESGTAAILVRAETSPDDVHGMARAAGILTSRGGMASHAAVVARGWGIPAVVGAAGIEVRDGQVVVGDRVLPAGRRHHDRRRHWRGLRRRHRRRRPRSCPRPGRCWRGPRSSGSRSARRRRVRAARPRATAAADAHRPTRSRPTTACGRSRSRASPRPQGVADVVLSTPDDVQPILDQLVVDGLVATARGRLPPDGIRHRPGPPALLAAEQAAWGSTAPSPRSTRSSRSTSG